MDDGHLIRNWIERKFKLEIAQKGVIKKKKRNPKDHVYPCQNPYPSYD